MPSLAIQPNDNEPLLRATYGAAAVISPAPTPGLIWTMRGVAGKVIKIKSIQLSAGGTTAGFMSAQLKRFSAQESGGTPVVMPPMSHDPNDLPSSVVMRYYTANPTPGAVVGVIHGGRIGFSTGGQLDRLSFQYAWLNDKPICLRGTNDVLAWDLLGGAVPAGGVLDIDVEWTEETAGGPFDSQIVI